MKLGKMMLAVVGVVAVLALAASMLRAETALTPKQLIDEAQRDFTSHNYDGALKRLQQVDRNALGLLDKGGYDSLLANTQKAVEGKAADEKALAEGQGALTRKDFAAAVKQLSQAASSEFLGDEKIGQAKGLLRMAQDGQMKAQADADKAAKDKAASDKASADKAAADKAAKDKVAADKAAADKVAADKKADADKAAAKSQTEKLYAEGKSQLAARDYQAAQATLKKVDREQLGFFEKLGFDGLVRDASEGVPARAAAEKALAEGKEALTAKKYAAATDKLDVAASSNALPAAKADEAKAALALAKAENEKAVAQAKNLVTQGSDALAAGKTADARKSLDAAKAMNVDMGFWSRNDIPNLESRVKAAEASAPALASKPVAKPAEPKTVAVATAVVTVKPAEPKPVAVKPAEPKPVQVASAVPAKPAEPKPAAKAPAATKPAATKAPVAAPVAAPVPPPPAAPALSLAQQAKRAEAEDAVQMGDDAVAHHEYEKARIYYTRAMSLWPESPRARKGHDQALKLLAEREEPLAPTVRDVRELERQRIIAAVQELLSQAEREMGRADRPEGYTEALRPLSQADRTIDVATVLTPEEQERLREEVLVLKKEIQTRRGEAEAIRAKKAQGEAVAREEERRKADRTDRENKVRQLWERATELRRSMQFGEAVQVLDTLLQVDPNDERAIRWKEDLLYLESQGRQVRVRTDRELGAVEALTDVEAGAVQPGEEVNGKVKYLRYPMAKDWKELSETRKQLASAVHAEPKAVAETRRRLSEEIDIDFEKTSLDNVLKYIGEIQRGLNLVIDPDVTTAGIDLSTRVVDLKVKRVAVEQVLGLILGAELGYRVESGYILITTKEKLQQNLPVVTYPVQDLVAQIPDFGGQAPRFEVGDVTASAASSAGGGGVGSLFGGGGAATTETPTAGPQDLVDLITRTVSNQSDPTVAAWSDEGGPAAIQFMNGLLICTQTRKGHEKVSDLLEQLRRERAIMISVEARFCQVSDQFLQDITLDVDAAFTNTGNPHFLGQGGAPFAPIQNAGNVAAGGAFNTLPGIPPDATFPVQQGQPIIVSGTGSNGQGTAKLLPLGGSAFANFAANEGGMTVSGVFLDDVQVGFLLRAIQADVRATTLQAPRLTLYNGQRSYLSVATVNTYISDVQPVVAEAAVGWDPTIGAIPVGVTLDVKATVSADRRYVQMDLRPQVASLGNPPFRQAVVTAAVPNLGIATATIDLPNVNIQDFKTTVSVPDGGTLLLGGTRTFNETDAETGVPVLSKVPILKRLFNNRATLRQATNLLILMKPKIIIQAEEESKLGYDNL